MKSRREEVRRQGVMEAIETGVDSSGIDQICIVYPCAYMTIKGWIFAESRTSQKAHLRRASRNVQAEVVHQIVRRMRECGEYDLPVSSDLMRVGLDSQAISKRGHSFAKASNREKS